ncbi:MAG: ABC transporter permease [Myxococcales bacterium]|nr:MAG: ABC transporter permease [Myxococcales bacterium]
MLNYLSKLPLKVLTEIGIFTRLFWQTVQAAIRPPYRVSQLLSAMEFVGVQSIFIVGLTAAFVGMVFGIQFVYGIRQFGAENQTGAVVGLALSRELAPVFAALMISSRAGSAMCTEIASMRVTNQIDALTTMAVNPVQYLIVPRVLAEITMVPLLTMLFNIVGAFGAWFVCVNVLALDSGMFIDKITWFVDTRDIMQGLLKASVFGLALTFISCRHGFYAKGGAAGVGQATTRAVVHSAVGVLILDYFITRLITGDAGL